MDICRMENSGLPRVNTLQEPLHRNSSEREHFNRRLFALAAAMLFIISMVLGWLFLKEKAQSEKMLKKADEEKMAVQTELRDLLADYQELKSQNTDLNTKLESERDKIKTMLVQMDKLKADAEMIGKYRKEAATLRKLIKVYLHQVDSLNTSIRIVKEEKQQVEVKLKEEKHKTEKLTTEKEKLTETVEMGSQLKTYGISAIGVRYSGGGEREKPIAKARKTERIKVCFTIGENAITQNGQKTIYLRVSNEQGNVFPYKGDSANAFESEGKQLAYSAKKEIEYQNRALDLCMYFEKTEDLKPGKYAVDVFCEGKVIGETELQLE